MKSMGIFSDGIYSSGIFSEEIWSSLSDGGSQVACEGGLKYLGGAITYNGQCIFYTPPVEPPEPIYSNYEFGISLNPYMTNLGQTINGQNLYNNFVF